MADLRFYRLTQLEQHGAGASEHIGLWELDPSGSPALNNVEEVPEWLWDGIHFYRTDNSHVLWVGIPEGMSLDSAAETIAERLGLVEIPAE